MTDESPAAASKATDQNTLGPLAAPVQRVSIVVGAIGLGLGFAFGLFRGDGLRYFFHAYLTSFAFYLSISLGALFFVLVQHATRAGWSVTVRRLAEIFAGNIRLLIILFLPIIVPVLLGSHALYEWADPAAVAEDSLLQHKVPYLNLPFFGLRCVAYFAVWLWLSQYFLKRSTAQDESGDAELTLQMERLSPVGLILFALTVTFASFDWLMSLAPQWFSTIFGVYYFSGALVGSLAVLILVGLGLQAAGRIGREITIEHYHDLGKLLFAFVVFWGYIAFSQYMLIWYANIPEETVWYLARQTGPWVWVSLALLFGHLLIPFFGLLSRHVKRSRWLLAFWAVWLAAFHWLDMYYLVMPSLKSESLPLAPIDFLLLVGMGGFYVAGAVRVAGQRSLVPVHDPRLGEALRFENA